MSKYSRSVIPGRPAGDEPPSDLDRLIFGGAARPNVRMRGGQSAETGAEAEERLPPEADEFDDDPPPRILQDAGFADRSREDRRKGARRKAEYKPLPGHGPPEDSRRGAILLGGTVLVAGVFAAVLWNAYSGGLKSADAATAPMLESPGPFKSKPDLPEAPSAVAEQASVFDRVEARPPVADQRAEEAPDVAEPAEAVAPPVVAPPVTTAVTPAPAPQLAQQAPVQLVPSAPVTAPVRAEPKLESKPVAAPPPLAAAPPALAGGFKPAFAPDGGHVVQVASLKSEAEAQTEWNRLKRANPDMFGAANSSIVRADVNGETRYRLRVAAFATPADADAFCSQYKSKGGACYRTAK